MTDAPATLDDIPRQQTQDGPAVRLYLVDGLSTTELAQRLGSNRESVRKLLLKYGILLRPRSYPGIRG